MLELVFRQRLDPSALLLRWDHDVIEARNYRGTKGDPVMPDQRPKRLEVALDRCELDVLAMTVALLPTFLGYFGQRSLKPPYRSAVVA